MLQTEITNIMSYYCSDSSNFQVKFNRTHHIAKKYYLFSLYTHSMVPLPLTLQGVDLMSTLTALEEEEVPQEVTILPKDMLTSLYPMRTRGETVL